MPRARPLGLSATAIPESRDDSRFAQSIFALSVSMKNSKTREIAPSASKNQNAALVFPLARLMMAKWCQGEEVPGFEMLTSRDERSNEPRCL